MVYLFVCLEFLWFFFSSSLIVHFSLCFLRILHHFKFIDLIANSCRFRYPLITAAWFKFVEPSGIICFCLLETSRWSVRSIFPFFLLQRSKLRKRSCSRHISRLHSYVSASVTSQPPSRLLTFSRVNGKYFDGRLIRLSSWNCFSVNVLSWPFHSFLRMSSDCADLVIGYLKLSFELENTQLKVLKYREQCHFRHASDRKFFRTKLKKEFGWK